MVRATPPPDDNTSDSKKESTSKKKAPAKKKPIVTGVWPCKINGCNKQFAREADLKRHQRTTKLHSMPGFACPQCDATFTRTDALRRHQKSRHNGVVIEPNDAEKKDGEGEGESSGSKSRSNSADPSAKGKERMIASTVPTVPGRSNPSGPSSYYRQHTLTSAYLPLRPMESQYGQGLGIPTSATRLNQATTWTQPHPWPEGSQQLGPMSFQVPGTHPVYYQSPYYRPNGPIIQPPIQLSPNPDRSSQAHSSSHPPSQANPVSPATAKDEVKPQSADASATTASSSHPLGPSVIDPSLQSDSDTNRPLSHEEIKAISLEITQAAMEAVLESAKLESIRAAAEAEANGIKNNGDDFQAESGSSRQLSGDTDKVEEETISQQLVNSNSHSSDHLISDSDDPDIHGYGRPLERPEPMEHMLTEDGEPMLNPAELLTQESLASPPPS